jgi:poly-gamma-glutamate capsule biosynthesis protein CapA/YwtB (metallophosphatase superfamily)
MKKRLLFSFTLFMSASFITGCEDSAPPKNPEPPSTVISSTYSSPKDKAALPPPSTPTPRTIPEPVIYRATFSAIGDILLHNTVYEDARTDEQKYDFSPMLEPVKDLLQQPDIVIANQESITGGISLGLSSYPNFNSPHEIGDALLDAGIDLVTMANNHSLDKGEKGILSATDYWNQIGMPYTGAFRSSEDRDQLRVLTKNGVSFAILSYTYGTNGIRVPADKPYLVNRIEPERMMNEIQKAKQAADVVVVAVHWGIEYQAKPSEDQIELAHKLADWGADIIVGTHPHVLQPIEWITRTDGKRTLAIYSLGNFLSAQDQLPRLIGGIAQVDIIKTEYDGSISIELKEPSFIPTYNKYSNWRNYRVIPLNRLEDKDQQIVQPTWNTIKKRLQEAMPELEILD